MWARIENDTVKEITNIDPAGRFHSSLVWVEFDPNETDVHQGYKYNGSQFSAPSDSAEVFES